MTRWPDLCFGDGRSWLMAVWDFLYCEIRGLRLAAVWDAPSNSRSVRFESAGTTHDGFSGVVKSCLTVVAMHDFSYGGAKSCLILVGATHDVSSMVSSHVCCSIESDAIVVIETWRYGTSSTSSFFSSEIWLVMSRWPDR